VLNFIARELSQETWINLMDQYRPCFEADLHPPLDRRITRLEYKEVRELARHAGLKNLL
jgi:putative pyruvate formate lyase activating enzyme